MDKSLFAQKLTAVPDVHDETWRSSYDTAHQFFLNSNPKLDALKMNDRYQAFLKFITSYGKDGRTLRFGTANYIKYYEKQ